MPGLITHYLCGELCLNNMDNPKARRDIQAHRQMYNIGTQGPDIFFYYLPCLYRKSLWRLGNKLHETKVRDFLGTMIDSAYALKDDERSSALSYLSGYLTHYALDCAAHPYIYYKSGFKVDGDRSLKLKYSVSHRNFETGIDVLMLKLVSSQKPSDKKLWQLIRITGAQAKTTAGIMSRAMEEIHGVRMSDRQIYRAMVHMFTANRILQSKGGKRKRLMEFLEERTVGDHVVSSLIHTQEMDEAIDFLNTKKSPWYYPWDKETEQLCSFVELFEKAVKESAGMIDALYGYGAGEVSREDLFAILGNRSLATGQDWELPLNFLYFERAGAAT